MEGHDPLPSQLRKDSGRVLQLAAHVGNGLVQPGGNPPALSHDARPDRRGRQAHDAVNRTSSLCGEAEGNSTRMVSGQVVTSLWCQIGPTPLKNCIF